MSGHFATDIFKMLNHSERYKILIIDDEESMRDSCRKVLAKQNYDLDLAENGDLGLARARSAKPDVIILDLKMPGLNGMEVLKELQKFHPLGVVIVITGYPSIESAVDAIKAGAYDFLPKPFTPIELRTVVYRAIEKKILLEKADKLEKEKERIRNNFVAIISHQMKSPLVAAAGCAEVLAKGLVGSLTEKQQSIADRIESRLRHLLNLIENTLKLFRLEATGRIEDIRRCNLREIAIRVWNNITQEIGHSSHSFEIRESKEPCSCIVDGDEFLIQEMFANLFSNSIKYTPEGGAITVEFMQEGSYVKVKISDTGCGIPYEEQPYVFDEFFRGKTQEKKVPGVGLGLTIVKRIIESHHGIISLESTPGQGTTFTISLTLAPVSP